MWRKEKKAEIVLEDPPTSLTKKKVDDLQKIVLWREDMLHLDAMKLQGVITEKRFKMEKQIIENSIAEMEREYGISD